MRKIGSARITDKHRRRAARERREPVHRGVGEVLLISDVAGQHDVPPFITADEVFEARRNGDPVLGGVGLDRGDGEGVDIGGLDRGRAGFGRRDRNEPGPGGEIEDPLALDQIGMVERVARERLPARPGERPERRRQAQRAQLLLGLLPQRHGLVSEFSLISGVSGGAMRRVFERTKSRLSLEEASIGIALIVRERYNHETENAAPPDPQSAT